MDLYRLDLEVDRICFDLNRKFDSIFNGFQKQISNLSEQIKSLEELNLLKKMLHVHENDQSKIKNMNYHDRLIMITEYGLKKSIEHHIDVIADELGLDIESSISVEDDSVDRSLYIQNVIDSSLKYYYLVYDIEHIRLKLSDSNRMVNLKIELTHRSTIKEVKSKLEEFLKNRIQRNMNQLNAIFREDWDRGMFTAVYDFPSANV